MRTPPIGRGPFGSPCITTPSTRRADESGVAGCACAADNRAMAAARSRT
jgi:hypothetical protein